MRKPRIGFIVRTVLIVVAVYATVALMFYLCTEVAHRREMSVIHAQLRDKHRRELADHRAGRPVWIGGPPGFADAMARHAEQSAAREDAWSRKWAAAASRPWLPVSPDRPESN